MTAETLKPFITATSPASMSNYISGGGNTRKSFLSIGFLVLMFVLLGGIFGFTMWKVFQLQNDVDSLNNLVKNMQRRLGFVNFNDLHDLEKAYSLNNNDLIDDDDDDDDDGNLSSEDLLDPFGEDDDDDYSEEDDFNFNGSGKDPLLDENNYDGNGDDDNDDDDDDDDDSDAVDDSLLDDYTQFYRDRKRKTRSISEVNGLPIYHESYALRRNKTGGPEDAKIEKLLLNKSPLPMLRYDWNDKGSRRDIVAPKKQYLESRAGPETIIQLPQYLLKQPPNNKNQLNPNHFQSVGKSTQNSKPRIKSGILSIQYNLNPGYTKGNLRIKNDGLILTPTSSGASVDESFVIESNGMIRIKIPGVYLIYAQISYDNENHNNKQNGYVILHNSHIILECISTQNQNHSCYTSGAKYLFKNDRIQIQNSNQYNSNMIYGNGKSFLGFIRLGHPMLI